MNLYIKNSCCCAITALVLLFCFSPIAMAADGLVASDDAARGRITVENDLYKATWGYKALAEGDYNKSGGNLVALYHKTTDTQLSRNLINQARIGDGTSLLMVGVGGAGMTHLYASDTVPSASETNRFSDLIGDNNLSGTLVTKSVQSAPAGAVKVIFEYTVKNQRTNINWYTVTKEWLAHPDGSIDLKMKMTFLRSGYISEPAIAFKFDGKGGWTNFEKYGHDWSSQFAPNRLVSITGINTVSGQTWDRLNRFHPRWVRLTGSPSAPDITVEAMGGFEALGAYSFGKNLWGSAANPIMEQNAYKLNSSTAYTMVWTAWWGGNPPTGSRYRYVPATSSYTDNYKISLVAGPEELLALPRVNDIRIDGVTKNSVTVKWQTDKPADSTLEYTDKANVTRSIHLGDSVLDHAITVTGLDPLSPYSFRIISGGTEAVGGNGTFSTNSIDPQNIDLSLSVAQAYWGSFQDYQDRFLTVDYEVLNVGQHDVLQLRIDKAYATAGSMSNTQLPIDLGPVPVQTNKTFSLLFTVPSSTQTFNAYISGIATDSSGQLHAYPQN